MAELSGKTLCQTFLDTAASRCDQVALREKEYGIWQRVTWHQYREHVTHFALGLKVLGFLLGDHLAIISENLGGHKLELLSLSELCHPCFFDKQLDICKKAGREPNKPFSGKFLVRINSELYQRP